MTAPMTLSQAFDSKTITLTYYLVDVFTNTPFGGAQIAVFPDAMTLSAQQMKTLARELNLSDTVFMGPRGTTGEFDLRIFAPEGERSFGGQATIAAAFILGQCGFVELTVMHTPVTLHQSAGLVKAVISRKEDTLFIQFSRSAQAVVDRYVPSNQALATTLSLREQDIQSRPYQTMLVSCEQPYLIVPLTTFEAVRKARFNLKEWSSTVAPVSATTELLLFSTRSDSPSSNFHGRLVGPHIGVDTDPPIASVMPAFTGYLAAHEHVRQGTYAFVIDRGESGTRKSRISVEMVNRQNRENEIRVGGPAVLVAEGRIVAP